MSNKDGFNREETVKGYMVFYDDFEERLSGLDVEATQEKVCRLLKESGLKDREISEQLGVTPQAVNKWRHKGCFLDIENLYVLSGMLKVKVDDFLVPQKKKDGLMAEVDVEEKPENHRQSCETRICLYAKLLMKLLEHRDGGEISTTS